MATYLEIAQTLARRMGGVVREDSDRRGIALIVGKAMRKKIKNYVTFPQTPNPAEDVWVPGGHVTWEYTENTRSHITALRPIFVAAGRPGATWADLEAETDFAQLRERAKGLNEALGVDLLYVNIGTPTLRDTPESLWLRPILEAHLRVFLGEPVGEVGWAATKAAFGLRTAPTCSNVYGRCWTGSRTVHIRTQTRTRCCSPIGQHRKKRLSQSRNSSARLHLVESRSGSTSTTSGSTTPPTDPQSTRG